MSELYEIVRLEVESLIAEVKLDTADKILSLSEVWTLAAHCISSFVKIADKLDVEGKDKKQVVMEAAEKLYDEVIAPLDIPKIPNMVEPMFDRLAKSVYLEILSGIVDFVVKFTKKD